PPTKAYIHLLLIKFMCTRSACVIVRTHELDASLKDGVRVFTDFRHPRQTCLYLCGNVYRSMVSCEVLLIGASMRCSTTRMWPSWRAVMTL
ncbi:hypothetical protein L9F63_024549, partial [Diploptera punctata]